MQICKLQISILRNIIIMDEDFGTSAQSFVHNSEHTD